MGLKKGVITKKVTDSHTTLTSTASEILKIANTFSEVTKIGIGIIKHIGGGGEKRIKFLPISGGIKTVVRGNGAVQELFIYTENSKSTENQLKEFMNKL